MGKWMWGVVFLTHIAIVGGALTSGNLLVFVSLSNITLLCIRGRQLRGKAFWWIEDTKI